MPQSTSQTFVNDQQDVQMLGADDRIAKAAEKIVFQLGSASNGNYTLKFQISNSVTQPDFSSAASVTNHWSYVDVIDGADGASIDGATGIVATGTDLFKNVTMNFDRARWVCATITAHAAGAITLKAEGVTFSHDA